MVLLGAFKEDGVLNPQRSKVERPLLGAEGANEAQEAPQTDVTKFPALHRPLDWRLGTSSLNLPGSWHRPSQFWAQSRGTGLPCENRSLLSSGVGGVLLSAVGLPGQAPEQRV